MLKIAVDSLLEYFIIDRIETIYDKRAWNSKTVWPRKEILYEKTSPISCVPESADGNLKGKSFVDYQNDVKLTDLRIATQEGYESVEHLKRYTTLGMATDQGKLSNINGIKILSNLVGKEINEIL